MNLSSITFLSVLIGSVMITIQFLPLIGWIFLIAAIFFNISYMMFKMTNETKKLNLYIASITILIVIIATIALLFIAFKNIRLSALITLNDVTSLTGKMVSIF